MKNKTLAALLAATLLSCAGQQTIKSTNNQKDEKNKITKKEFNSIFNPGMILSEEKPRYDQDASKLTGDEMKRLFDSCVKVEFITELENKTDSSKKFSSLSCGSGTALLDRETGDDYVLTAYHVVTLKKSEIIGKKISSRYLKANNLDAQIFKYDQINDLVLLKVEGDLENHYIGDISDNPGKGDFILRVGFTLGMQNQNLFTGRVEGIEKMLGFIPCYIKLNSHITPGDSGGPVYVLKEGLGLLSGITLQLDPNNRGRVGRSSPSDDIINIIKDTPLEDYYKRVKKETKVKKE